MSNINKIYFKPNGYYIEFPELGTRYFSFVIRRILYFLIDSSIFQVALILLWQVFSMNIFTLTIIIYILLVGYLVGTTLLMKNKTIGMKFLGARITNFDGKSAISNNQIIIRSLFSALYLIPIIGWILALLSAFSIIVTRGVMLQDYISKTQVLTKYGVIRINNIYKVMERSGDDSKNKDQDSKFWT